MELVVVALFFIGELIGVVDDVFVEGGEVVEWARLGWVSDVRVGVDGSSSSI